MNSTLPRRIDSGIRLTGAGEVHRKADHDKTLCGLPIGLNAKRESDNAILVKRLSKCRECWRPDGNR